MNRSWGAAAVCLLAGFLFATSATTANGTDLRPGERGDLISLLRGDQQRVQEGNARLSALTEEVRARAAAHAASGETPVPGPSNHPNAAMLAGLQAVKGPALTVVLDDAPPDARAAAPPDAKNDDFVVHQQDVQAVVNALWAGGAEAMQLMDQRVIATSAVRCVGSTLLLQGRVYPPPYRITAIGSPDAMRKALEQSTNVSIYREYVDLVGLRYDVTEEPAAVVPAYDGLLGINRAKPLPSPTAAARRS